MRITEAHVRMITDDLERQGWIVQLYSSRPSTYRVWYGTISSDRDNWDSLSLDGLTTREAYYLLRGFRAALNFAR